MSNHKTKKYQINAGGRNEGKGARGVLNIRNMAGILGVTEERQIGEGKGKREGHGEGEREVKTEGDQDLVLFVHILWYSSFFILFLTFFSSQKTQPRIYLHAPRVLHASCLRNHSLQICIFRSVEMTSCVLAVY